MTYEVEYKALVADPARLVATLAALGARPSGHVVEHDRYLRHPCRDLPRTDEALRLRATYRLDLAPDDDGRAAEALVVGRTPDRLRATYKGPGAPGPTRSRLELEAEAPSGWEHILAALGFAPVAAVWKRRTRHTLDGLEVTCDLVDGLGAYAEVEATTETGDAAEMDAARTRVLALVRRLGLGAEEPRSYLELRLAGARHPP